MDEDFIEMVGILKKVLPVLLKNPDVMAGCDISEGEIYDIKDTKKISLKVMQHVAGDQFFEAYGNEVNLNKREAKKVGRFLAISAPHFLDELKEKIPYLRK